MRLLHPDTVNPPRVRLRTRPIVLSDFVRPEPRRCEGMRPDGSLCQAVLRSKNTSRYCDPCRLAGRAIEEAQPVDEDAPECACGCGGRTLRAVRVNSHTKEPRRTGPYQKYLMGHAHKTAVKGGQ